MTKKYFDFDIYDVYFSDKIIERGVEIYLSNKFYNYRQNNNSYSCNIKGTESYEVKVTFKEYNQIANITCTCPFAQTGSKCKHMYALLLKVKCNYDLKKIKKQIKKELKDIKAVLDVFDKDYIRFKKSNFKYRNDIESLKRQIDCMKIIYKNILKHQGIIADLITMKDIITLRNMLYKQIDNFNEYMKFKVIHDDNSNIEDEEEYIEDKTETKGFGLFGLFMHTLNEVNKESERLNREYEKEKEKYRRTIIEQNLYDGKNNDKIYDGLE